MKHSAVGGQGFFSNKKRLLHINRYGEVVDLASLDLSSNKLATSQGFEVDLDGTRVFNCTGYTPNTDFLPRAWLDGGGFVVCTAAMEVAAQAVPKAQRLDPTAKFCFAMGDVCVSS